MKRTKHNQGVQGQSRRDFLKLNAVAGAGFLMPWVANAGSHITANSSSVPALNPKTIPKFVQPLYVYNNTVMPRSGAAAYDLAIRQFRQQILPPGYQQTWVAGYGPTNSPVLDNDADLWHTPAFPIVTTANEVVNVTWRNQQVAANGGFLPHVLSDDLFLKEVMWANPQGPRDSFGSNLVSPYRGPVPIVTHLHGGASKQEADGHPLAWYLPNANNIPNGFYREGTLYNGFEALGGPWDPGTARFTYAENEVATLLWCHDHTLGITEFNVYGGFAGAYLVTGGAYDVPAGVLPSGPYHIPLVIQDRAFKINGQLLFNHGKGNTTMVNGRTWPYLNVEQRRYRFRILNGCNDVNQRLQFSNGLPLWVIGGDIGFMPRAVAVGSLPLSNAERADVIVDFTNVPVGTVFYLQNDVGEDTLTGLVLKLTVVPRTSADTTTAPNALGALPVKQLADPPVLTRRLAILDSKQGIINAAGNAIALEFEDPPTELPKKGSTEIWEFWGFDEHPMHLHAMKFQVLGRRSFGSSNERAPAAWERGLKDTVAVNGGGITRVKVKFDNHAGLFVWHCHILEHEDKGMMRPLELQP